MSLRPSQRPLKRWLVASVAQLVEQLTLNQLVLGSSPSRGTTSFPHKISQFSTLAGRTVLEIEDAWELFPASSFSLHQIPAQNQQTFWRIAERHGGYVLLSISRKTTGILRGWLLGSGGSGGMELLSPTDTTSFFASQAGV